MPAMDYSKVAELYDLYARTDADVGFFLQETRGCRSVLELTCGTGRLSLPLIQAGVPLTCLDNSPEMLAVLRRKLLAKGLSAPVHEMDATCFSLPDGEGTLFLSSLESYDAGTRLVTGAQFYELYDTEGRMLSKRFVDLKFHLHTHETFETLAKSHDYHVTALYGDYNRGPFRPGASPFMIWVLGK
jgi:SAM-dependent methyltransferase